MDYEDPSYFRRGAQRVRNVQVASQRNMSSEMHKGTEAKRLENVELRKRR